MLAPLSLGILGALLIALLVVHSFLKGKPRVFVGFLLNILSVVGFISFLLYFHTFLLSSCPSESIRTVALILVFFVLLSGLFFYYLGRKKM
jgi:hypothetical protein